MRYSQSKVQSHLGVSLNAIQVLNSSTKNLLKLIVPETEVIAIDEIQFFDNEIVQACEELANTGKRIILAGLDLDFRGEPFGANMLSLIAKADILDKLTAICVICGGEAIFTQRKVNGAPAKWDDPIYAKGSTDTYEPVCRVHHCIEKPDSSESKNRYRVIENI